MNCELKTARSGLDPAAQIRQRLPAGVIRSLIAGAGLKIAIRTAARAKSLAVGLAQRPDRQGQKHLLAQHIFKQQTVSLIITDFGLRRRNGALGNVGIGAEWPEDEVELGGERDFDGLDAARAGNLKNAREAAPEADVRDDVSGPAMLVDHLGAARSGQIADLHGFLAEIDGARSELQVEFNRFALEFNDSEFHKYEPKAQG